MSRFRAALVASVLLAASSGFAGATRATRAPGPPGIAELSAAVTELDLARAREIVGQLQGDSLDLAFERARLSLYASDCDAAAATLSSLSGVKEALWMTELAESCARATAAAVIHEDAARGLFIRLQDEADRVLVPRLSEVSVQARDAIEKELGVVMPRPLRIDLVRDLFSLSAVTGLPLEAAETTGTVAVARFGRVNMISPRATVGGFPWEDTLAHEIVHLALSRATRDHAPLWLQEGLAKRLEVSWRAGRRGDAEPPADRVARDAFLSGQAIRLDQLGPSIAMLPSADAASIAFAEASSFIGYWLAKNGRAALHLVLADLKGLGPDGADAALRSASGYSFSEWLLLWEEHLLRLPEAEGDEATRDVLSGLGELLGESSPLGARERSRRLRSSELLLRRGEAELASDRLRPVLAGAPGDSLLRYRLGRSLLAAGQEDEASPLFADASNVQGHLHPGWLALHGRFSRAAAREPEAAAAFQHARSLSPYLEDAACEGEVSPGVRAGGAGAAVTRPPSREQELRALCEAARKIPSD